MPLRLMAMQPATCCRLGAELDRPSGSQKDLSAALLQLGAVLPGGLLWAGSERKEATRAFG